MSCRLAEEFAAIGWTYSETAKRPFIMAVGILPLFLDVLESMTDILMSPEPTVLARRIPNHHRSLQPSLKAHMSPSEPSILYEALKSIMDSILDILVVMSSSMCPGELKLSLPALTRLAERMERTCHNHMENTMEGVPLHVVEKHVRIIYQLVVMSGSDGEGRNLHQSAVRLVQWLLQTYALKDRQLVKVMIEVLFDLQEANCGDSLRFVHALLAGNEGPFQVRGTDAIELLSYRCAADWLEAFAEMYCQHSKCHIKSLWQAFELVLTYFENPQYAKLMLGVTHALLKTFSPSTSTSSISMDGINENDKISTAVVWLRLYSSAVAWMLRVASSLPSTLHRKVAIVMTAAFQVGQQMKGDTFWSARIVEKYGSVESMPQVSAGSSEARSESRADLSDDEMMGLNRLRGVAGENRSRNKIVDRWMQEDREREAYPDLEEFIVDDEVVTHAIKRRKKSAKHVIRR